MKNIQDTANNFIEYAKEYLELKSDDEIYLKNRVLEVLARCDGDQLTADETDEIYGLISLLPSEINAKFQRLLQEDSKKATDWFYNYCVKNDYVKKAVLDKNPRFESNGLIVTINKAKPEFRDPNKAVAGNRVENGFVKCVICRENEGFGGKTKRNLRTLSLTLDNEKWFWQYSPYGYFNEHGIAVNCEHIPMHVDKSTFYKLMDFVDIFPHYFIGCNAPLARIGGSVLAHDHFQGGGEILPMHKAGAAYTLKHKSYPDATVEVVDWQGTVIRIVSKNRDTVAELSDIIRKAWENYENKELGIIPKDADGIHSTISPTVVKTARGYEMSNILRNNITSEAYPDGVFHAHPEYHVVKKESIGLIEAQGLFILPGRLEAQLEALGQLVANGQPLTAELADFALVYDEVSAIYNANKHLGVNEAIKTELGSICARILNNTAVFKDKQQTVRFLLNLGFDID